MELYQPGTETLSVELIMVTGTVKNELGKVTFRALDLGQGGYSHPLCSTLISGLKFGEITFKSMILVQPVNCDLYFVHCSLGCRKTINFVMIIVTLSSNEVTF